MRALSLFFALLTLILLIALLGCNEHPLSPFETAVSSAQHERDVQPPRAQMDLLFVVDNSQSMCQEQANLARNFRTISDFLFDELGPAADFRVAITSTDLTRDGGRFLARPASPVPQVTCDDFVPDTADCFDGPLDPIIRSGADLDKAELERRFRCLATLGTTGDSQEKGLEAMRLALSCAGPNRDAFGECCVDGTYDPTCQPDVDPDFLRPAARLVVVFISDEDDCSDPAANPGASTRALCKYGPNDGDGDGAPDGYGDPTLCDGLSPRACFARDCDDEDAETCYARCAVAREPNACAWGRDDLVAPHEYVRFLNRRKAQPGQQVLVAAIVGGQVRTAEGDPITYNAGEPPPGCAAEDVSEACCPGGRCAGPEQPTCTSENGEATAGRRYLALTEAFGPNGIGCRPEDEGTEACLSICTDEFTKPLARIKAGLIDLLNLRCLDKAPACTVWEDGAVRPCASAEEVADPDNYEIHVSLSCPPAEPDCAEPAADWRFIPEDQSCSGGPAVRLGTVPAPGVRVSIDYRVAL